MAAEPAGTADSPVAVAVPPFAVPTQTRPSSRKRSVAVWAAALAVYALAVFHRTSLGVAGLAAADRFHISASQLATFTVLQLLVYAAMQVPVGLLLDRHGARTMLLGGLALMTVGQLSFAFASSFETGVLSRVLVGAGDAMVFVSVLRIVTAWFAVGRIPLFTQLTGQFGQIGAIAASFPLAAALSGFGWTPTFLAASLIGVVLAVVLLVVVRDAPGNVQRPPAASAREIGSALRSTWATPGTRLGLWTHFSSQFAMTVFVLAWGYPFLVAGEGVDPAMASALLVLMTITTIVAGPVVGTLVGRYPMYRAWLSLGVVGAIALMWTVVLLWPGPAPLPVLVLLVAVTAIGGPSSMIGFDQARSFNPSERMGGALGVVNVGGFVASLVAIGLIGVILDHVAPGGPSTYTLGDFRIALAVQFVLWGFGATQIWRYRRKTVGHLQEHYPEALSALRNGEALLPGIHRP